MQWVLEHIQVIVAVAAAIVYMLNKGREAPEDEADSGEDAERARRVREEIQRKISERRDGTFTPQREEMPEEAPPVLRTPGLPPIDSFGGPARPSLPVLRKAEPALPTPQMSHAAMTAVLERQQDLAEQLRELERTREAQLQRTAEIKAAAVEAALPAAPASRGGLLEDLRQAQNLRRAVLLREVLGPPVGLR